MHHTTGAVLALVLCALPLVDAKRKSTVSSMDEFWMFFAVIYSLVLLPVVSYFLYALARDPATPELARLMWQWFKRKTFGLLGPNRDPAVQQQRPAVPLVQRDTRPLAGSRKRM